MTVMRTWTTFPDCVKKRLFCTCAMIVHTLVDQFLLQLLMDSRFYFAFTLQAHCYLHEDV